MFRRLLPVLAIALLAASCSTSEVLATVNGVDITEQDLYQVYPEWEESTNLSGEDLRQAVSNLVVFEAIGQAAEDQYGVVLDDAAIAERMENPPDRYATILVPELMTGTANDEIRRLNAVQSLLTDAIGPQLFAADLGGYDGWLESRPETVARVCMRYILVATTEDAANAIDRLNAGEDFAVVVAEVSLDQSAPDGLLVNDEGSCLISLALFNDTIVVAAIDAELGEPIGPVPIGTSYAVLRFEDRVLPTPAELAADPMEWADPAPINATYSGWTSDVLREADISVSPVLGRWSSAGFGIEPPPN
ncbi:MAG: hypothetical protein QNJ81_05515 [Acidimicrobiia bacterium]|nr:hypothetical protein [Acidimicrobiia bacterium]